MRGVGVGGGGEGRRREGEGKKRHRVRMKEMRGRGGAINLLIAAGMLYLIMLAPREMPRPPIMTTREHKENQTDYHKLIVCLGSSPHAHMYAHTHVCTQTLHEHIHAHAHCSHQQS